jgi:hypothetical protein
LGETGTDRSLRVVGHIALFLGGLLFVGLASLATSCHVHDTAAARDRDRVLGAHSVRTISSGLPLTEPEGQMVHVTGLAQAAKPLVDPELGVAVMALALERRVSMYQWVETCREDDPPPEEGRPPGKSRRQRLGSRFACSYNRYWRSTVQKIERSEWAHVYRNPPFPVKGEATSFEVSAWRVGSIPIMNAGPPEIPSDALEPLLATPDHVRMLPEPLRSRARVHDASLYVGDPQKPQVGDLKIEYRYRPHLTVSIVGRVNGWGEVSPVPVPGGGTFLQIRSGTFTADEMAGARRSEGHDYWLNHVPLAAFFLIGSFMLYWPLRAMGRSIPGPPLVTGAGVLLFAPLSAAALHATTLAVSWLAQNDGRAAIAGVAAAAALALLPVLGLLRWLLSHANKDGRFGRG